MQNFCKTLPLGLFKRSHTNWSMWTPSWVQYLQATSSWRSLEGLFAFSLSCICMTTLTQVYLFNKQIKCYSDMANEIPESWFVWIILWPKMCPEILSPEIAVCLLTLALEYPGRDSQSPRPSWVWSANLGWTTFKVQRGSVNFCFLTFFSWTHEFCCLTSGLPQSHFLRSKKSSQIEPIPDPHYTKCLSTFRFMFL